MNSARQEGGGLVFRSLGLVTFFTGNRGRLWERLAQLRRTRGFLPIKTFSQRNQFRFNNYQGVDVKQSMSTGEKIR